MVRCVWNSRYNISARRKEYRQDTPLKIARMLYGGIVALDLSYCTGGGTIASALSLIMFYPMPPNRPVRCGLPMMQLARSQDAVFNCVSAL